MKACSLARHPKTDHVNVLRGDDCIEKAVESAERSFVLKEYDMALRLSLEVLSAETDSCSYYETQCVCLETQIISSMNDSRASQGSWRIQMTQDITPLDRAAAIALQSSFETQNKDGESAFISYCQNHSIPLDLAILWVQFTHSTGHPSTAAQLAAELLHHSRQYLNLEKSTQELALFLFTKVLPYLKNANDALDLLNRINATSWSTVPNMRDQAFTRNVNQHAVTTLLLQLERMSPGTPVDDCREELSSLLKDKDNDVQMNHNIHNMIESRPIQSSLEKHDLQSRDWYLKFSKRLLLFFRTRFLHPLFNDTENRLENRVRVVMSILLLYFAWKKKRKLFVLTLSSANGIVSPFREIMEALLPSRQRAR
mmetsp:Transcript_17540/g.31696  ORF Transcript_17540/g.31696 Transcript_17540/m.31696 type:complete len:369 (+) Transcript_17540:130-1236(+)